MDDFARALTSLWPSRKQVARSAVPVGTTWGAPQPNYSYESFAREGYSQNEIVYAAIEVRATSTAEPEFAAWRGEEGVPRHPVLDLLTRPNRFLTGYQMAAGIMMYRDIAGNAFLLKERSASGKLLELWPLRPDRMFPLPDRDRYLAGWEYRIGAERFRIPVEDVIHFKTRNPLDDYRGLPPLAPAAGRVDIDNWMRGFVGAFFRNAGVPAGLLNVMRDLDDDERELIRSRFREDYGGPSGWHNLLVIDGAEAKYEAMGRDLGARGLVVPDLDKISEARIGGMVFGVPLAILGAVLGAESSSYANQRIAWQIFWQSTLAPIYRDLTETFTAALAPEYRDIDRVGFDLHTVQALAPDKDALHDRLRADLEAGVITREMFWELAGYEPPTSGTYLLKNTVVPWPVSVEAPPPPAPQEPGTNGNGKVPAEMMQ